MIDIKLIFGKTTLEAIQITLYPLRFYVLVFLFFPQIVIWYNIGITFYSVGSNSVILVLVVVGQYLTWAAGFLKIVAGNFDGCSRSSSLGYVGQLLKASVWLVIGPVAIIKG